MLVIFYKRNPIPRECQIPFISFPYLEIKVVVVVSKMIKKPRMWQSRR